jgi:hypothetical protein|tara:strand:+ start:351 stop:737 length:387 start_codon:yes stop_codon:yes gene_type:complete
MITTKDKLFTLWIFVTVNYIFCDIFTLFYSENLKQLMSGAMGGMDITETFLFAFSVIMELPMLMIVLSRLLPYKFNRLANIAVGIFMTLVQTATLFGDNMLHYVFFSIIEITTTIIIVWIAIRWKNEE